MHVSPKSNEYNSEYRQKLELSFQTNNKQLKYNLHESVVESKDVVIVNEDIFFKMELDAQTVMRKHTLL